MQLMGAFEAADAGNVGSISRLQWAEVSGLGLCAGLVERHAFFSGLLRRVLCIYHVCIYVFVFRYIIIICKCYVCLRACA